METAEVIIPALETLVTIDGTLSRPVKHIQFNGITFEHTSWMRPSYQGHVTLQGGFPLLDAYKLQEPGLRKSGTGEPSLDHPSRNSDMCKRCRAY